MTILLLDDAPFLIFRLVCIISYKVESYNSYFFAAKNVLVLALDLNTILSLHNENEKLRRIEKQSTELGSIGHSHGSLAHIRR